MHEHFLKDQVEILKLRAARGEISRRGFTRMAAALLGTTALGLRGTAALAQSGELVFVNWGGDAGAAYDEAYGKPFLAEAGITVKQDGSGPTEGAIAAQFESGKPAWDIVDADPFSESTFSTVVKDDSGRTLAAGKLLVSYVATAAQKYFVVVSTSDPYQPYDVTFLTSRGTPCDDDGHEPNDEAMNATKLNAATSLDGVVCPQDQDWFQLTVPTAKGLKASLVNYDSGKGLLKLCVFDGATLLGCDDATHPLVELGAAQVGDKTLLVRVDGSTERVSNGYTLQVEFP